MNFAFFDQSFKFEQTLKFNQWREKQNFEIENTQEYYYRLQIYLEKDKKIQKHNNLNLSWKLGHNQFSALTMQEFEDSYLMEPDYNDLQSIEFKKQKPMSEWNVTQRQKDWSLEGKTVPIRNQGSCGSCYAFVGSDILSSVNSILYNPQSFPKFLSPQYIVDCGPKFSPENLLGCGGAADVKEVGRFLKVMGTVDEQLYPYQGKEQGCPFFKPDQKTFLKNYSYVNEQYENVIKAIERAPVFIKVQANFSIMQYESGVIDIKGPCGLINDHVVQGIGYDLEADQPYIKIQNSWSRGWGEGGYAKIAIQQKSKTGMCGILNNAVLAFY